MLNVNQNVEDNVHIFTLSGTFDSYTSPEAREALQESAGQRPANIVVNLEGVNFVDSTGLATLVQAMKRSRQNEGDLLLCGLQQQVRMVFELTRLDQAFHIYPTERDAVAAFDQRSYQPAAS